MNMVKKIIALIMVIFVVIRVYVFSVSASFAAPFIAEETLKTVLIEGMLAGGADYTKDDLESWELEDLENEFEIQMTTNPNFKPKEAAPKIFPFIPFSDTVLGNFLSTMEENGAELYDFINPTYSDTIDMQGGVSVLYDYWAADRGDKRYYDVYYSSKPAQLYNIGGKLYYFIEYDYYESHSPSGVTRYDQSNTLSGNLNSVKHLRYGKWVWREDGTQAETDDEVIPVIGEADGTQVTPDMLNPDGTVTIDGVTYYPKDFIDWDKFKDPAIIDLLNEILKAIENVPVIDNSQTDIGEIDADVTLPSELSDFSTPGLIDVFPFCLPYDFIRGMRLFSAEPEVPHFETEIKIPAFLNVPAQTWKFEIDFKEFEPLAKITRWISLISFIYCLILLTPKIAKGA